MYLYLKCNSTGYSVLKWRGEDIAISKHSPIMKRKSVNSFITAHNLIVFHYFSTYISWPYSLFLSSLYNV